MPMMKTIRWRWGLLPALAMMLLSLFPQLYLWRDRGHAWNGAHAFCYTDEPAYASYVNALNNGRPRRNDPYSGRQDNAGGELNESAFSIQFFPAYVIAWPARALNLSTPTVFILLAPIIAGATALILFWFLALLLEDSRAAALLVPFVLCLGLLLSFEGLFRALLSQHTFYFYLPFLRRYAPGATFPWFIAFFALGWRALTTQLRQKRILYSVAAGLALTFCIYGYFHLWTAALAWLALLAILWLAARPARWRESLSALLVVTATAIVALVPYAYLLSQRAPTLDSVQALSYTRAPDLTRPIEVFALLIVIALVIGLKRGILDFRNPMVLVTTAFALLPFVVFNQQIITGRSLQPMHYEQFVVNYTTLIAAALAFVSFWRGRTPTRTLPLRLLLVIGFVSLIWGVGETWIATRRVAQANINRDEAVPVALRLTAIANSAGTESGGVVFAPDPARANTLPMIAPQPVLWAPLMTFFSGVDVTENRERLFQFLYYSGVDAAEFKSYYDQHEFASYALFGLDRVNPKLSVNYRSVTPGELASCTQEYASFVANFDAGRAARPRLGYLLLAAERPFDFAHLERWYQRDAGERNGAYMLYRLTPRESTK
jgi:hypothetical protein